MTNQGSIPPFAPTALPTQPGAYWYLSETAQWEILVQVRVKDGELIVWLLKEDVPVATLNGRWRGPIPPSTGPGGQKLS